jgi:hypothetical protein
MIRPAVPTAWSGGQPEPRTEPQQNDFVTETRGPTLPGLAPGSTAGASLPHSSPMRSEKTAVGHRGQLVMLPLADLGSLMALMALMKGGPIAGAASPIQRD